MSKPTWTRNDVAHLALVLTPLVVLAGMFAASAMTWRMERGKLQRLTHQIAGDQRPIDHATVARAYDAATSQAMTETWMRVLAATESLNGKYGGPFVWVPDTETDYETVTSPGVEWPPADLMSLYVRDAQPILADIEKLLESDQAIWVPIQFEGWNTLLTEAQQSRGVARLLHYSFLISIHSGHNDRALMIVRAFERLFGPDYESVMLVDELVRIACYSIGQNDLRDSLRLDVWSDDELAEIEKILSRPFDWDSRWKQVVTLEMLEIWPELVAGNFDVSRSAGAGPTRLVSFAPSVLCSVIENQERMASTRGAGTRQHVDAVGQAGREWMQGGGDGKIDRWLQVPTINSLWLRGAIWSGYEACSGAFLRSANDFHFTRTVWALRQYRTRFDSWPELLGRLTRVGLPASAIEALDGGRFAYEVTEDDRVVLWNHADKHSEVDSLGHRIESITMLP